MGADPIQSKTFSQEISDSNYIVRDHRVHDIRTLPGIALLDLIYRLSGAYLGTQAIELKRILFKLPVVTAKHFDQKILVTFTPVESFWKVTVTSQKIKNSRLLNTQPDENMECLLFLRESLNSTKLEVDRFIASSTRQ